MNGMSAGDRNSPRVTDRVTEKSSIGHPQKLPLTWDNSPRVTEGDRSSLVPDIKTRAGAGSVHTQERSPAVTRRRPPWLYDGPLTDRARIVSCNRCHRPVLEALADGVMPARVDLVHLTPLQELEHLLAGGTTLRLWPDRPHTTDRRLAFRHAWDICAHPGRGLPVHQCAVVRRPDPSLLTYRAHSAWPEEPTF